MRKTYSSEGIAALAANIRADGYRLLQNLVVRKASKRGRYHVTAGGRRLAALNLLAEAGEIDKDFPVACKERSADDATAISLAENLLREDMHPVDQYEAFSALAAEGKSLADIAARFSTTETMVRKRLALARVSPVLLQLYRDEEMTFEQLSAFTVSDDHIRQEEVWNNLPEWGRYTDTIRRTLAETMVRASDKRVRRDLFDERDDGYATDAALVEKLVAEKLEAVVTTVRAEGWKWVECRPDLPEDHHSLTRFYPESLPFSEADQAELDRLAEEYDELSDLIEAGEEVDDDASGRLDAIDARIDELRVQGEAYSSEALSRAGAYVSIGYQGEVRVERGLVRAGEDAGGKRHEAGESAAFEAEGEGAGLPPKPAHSAALIEDLSAQKTAALRAELANNPGIALVAVVHALLLAAVYPHGRAQSALDIRLVSERIEANMKQPEACTGLAAMEDQHESFGHRLPGDPADLWDWLLDQRQDELLTLLAYAAAQSVNAVEKKFTDRRDGIAQAAQLGQALKIDMTAWFTPDGGNYFSHISRAAIEAAVAEAKGPEAALAVRAAGKKTEAVAIAERLVRNTEWLPEPIRIAGAVADDGTAEAAGGTAAGDNAVIQPFPVAAE